jgi:hypothetical protein
MHEPDIRKATDREIAEFGKQLHKASILTSATDVLDYWLTPWKQAKEFELWTTLGRPHEGDPSWQRFCETIWRGEGAIREALLEHAARETFS